MNSRDDQFIQLYDFYINQGHWLCMDPDRLIDLLSGASIRDSSGLRMEKLNRAIILIRTSSPETKKNLQSQHFNRYKSAAYGNK